MKQVFIVRSEEGVRVISHGVVKKDIQSVLTPEQLSQIKDKDITSLSKDLVNNYNGSSIEVAEYDMIIKTVANTLIDYSQLTPFKFLIIVEQLRHLNQAQTAAEPKPSTQQD